MIQLRQSSNVFLAYSEDDMAVFTGNNTKIPVLARWVDNNFWKVFQFSFMEGKPFTEEEFNSGVNTVVIDQSLANQLFENGQATGKYVKYNNKDYRV